MNVEHFIAVPSSSLMFSSRGLSICKPLPLALGVVIGVQGGLHQFLVFLRLIVGRVGLVRC